MSTQPAQADPASLRVVVTNEQGAEQCRCTLAEFAKAHEAAWPKHWPKVTRNARMIASLAERIAWHGSDTIDCGAGGVFTLKA